MTEQIIQRISEDIREMRKQNEEIQLHLAAQTQLLQYLLKTKTSDKFEKVLEHTKRKGSIDVGDVRKLTNCTKTHCHNLLDKLSDYPGFVKRLCPTYKGKRVKVFYSNTEEEKTLLKIKEAIDKVDFFSINNVKDLLGIEDFRSARQVADLFCQTFEGYKVDESRYYSKKEPDLSHDIGIRKTEFKNA